MKPHPHKKVYRELHLILSLPYLLLSLPLPHLPPFLLTLSSPSPFPSQGGQVHEHGLPQQSIQTLSGSLQGGGVCVCMCMCEHVLAVCVCVYKSQIPAAEVR